MQRFTTCGLAAVLVAFVGAAHVSAVTVTDTTFSGGDSLLLQAGVTHGHINEAVVVATSAPVFSTTRSVNFRSAS